MQRNEFCKYLEGVMERLSQLKKAGEPAFILSANKAGSVIAISDTAGNIVEAFEVD